MEELDTVYAERASLLAHTVKNTCNVGDPGSIPGSGRFHGEGNSCLENYMERGA